MRRLHFVLALLLLALRPSADAHAQEELKLQQPVAPAGIGRLVPGQWGEVRFEVINPRDTDEEVLAVMHFSGRPDLQFGRRMWVPARSRRRGWYPVYTPADLPADKAHVSIDVQLLRASGDREVPIESRSGRRFHNGLVPVQTDRPVSGILADPEDDGARNLLASARSTRGKSVHVASVRPDMIPKDPVALDALDTLMLATDELTEDPVGLRALRQWLYEGGRMWIMLDEVDPTTVAALLGEAYRVEVVDRVDLTETIVESVRRGAASDDRPAIHSTPVELVRVFAPAARVTHQVNGWPAAFWQTVGQGEVLFTTLGPVGWYRERTPDDPQIKSSRMRSTYVAKAPLDMLASEFMLDRAAVTLAPEQLEAYAGDQIGYKIVGRGRVIMVLGLFCAGLIGAAVVLSRRQQLDRLGWIGPALAVIAAVVLLTWGRAARTAVPDMAVSGQLIEVSPSVGDLRVSGSMALYNQSPSEGGLAGTDGGYLLPELAGSEGSPRRLVWTDHDHWRWENLSLPSGARYAQFAAHATMAPADRIAASITFDKQGVVGQLEPGQLTHWGDAVLATPARRLLAIDFQGDGSFAAPQSNALGRGEYFLAAVLSDEQRRRQAVFAELFGRPAPPRFPPQPTLFVWTDPLNVGLTLPESTQRLGGALVSIPLAVDRPAAGSKIGLPAAFLPYASVAPPGEIAGSTTYDAGKDQWIGPLTAASRVLLRFQLPESLLPLTVTEAELTVRIDAPQRKLQIVALENGSLVDVAAEQSPIGAFSFTIDNPRWLQLDDRGGLQLGLFVGSIAGEALAGIDQVGWKIDDAWLTVRATVAQPNRAARNGTAPTTAEAD